jgi:hypothetical protein
MNNINYGICIDLGGTHLRSAIITNKQNKLNIIELSQFKTSRHKNQIIDTIIKECKNKLNFINNSLNKKDNTFIGISVSTGGVVDTNNGIILKSTNLINGWNNIPLKTILIKELKFLGNNINNIQIQNDGNCSGIAEQNILNINNTNFLVLTLGTGVGSALFINNRLQQYNECGQNIEKYVNGKYISSKLENINNCYINSNILKIKKNSFIYQCGKIIGEETIKLIKKYNLTTIIFNGPVLNLGKIFTNSIKININYSCKIIFSDIKEQGLIGAYYNLSKNKK